VLIGLVLTLLSGTALAGLELVIAQATKSINQRHLLGAAGAGASIAGPVNVLLVGVDSRPDQRPGDPSRSDSIIILHIPASHDSAYLISIPRDSLVQIPAYPKAGYLGGEDKINSAFALGSEGTGGLQGGFELLALTIDRLTGIRFNAGAIVDFSGFRDLVTVLGGVDMCVDERTTSIHVGFTADGTEEVPFHQDANLRLYPVPGVTPQVYYPGCQHLAPWQALDYVRQRDLLADGDGDYGRQRHQQQFLKAVFQGIRTSGALTNPAKLARILDVAGKAATIDSGGIPIADWIYAMRGVNPTAMVTIKTNAGTFNTVNIGGVSYEELTDTSMLLLHDVRDDTVSDFLAVHPDWSTAS
jgi:LCP family protein required for cell wall assembly